MGWSGGRQPPQAKIRNSNPIKIIVESLQNHNKSYYILLKSKAIKKNLVTLVKASIPLLMFWRKISFCLYRNSSKQDKKDNPNFVTLSMENHGNKRNLNDSSVLLKRRFMKEVITNGRMIKNQEEIFSQHTKVHLLL